MSVAFFLPCNLPAPSSHLRWNEDPLKKLHVLCAICHKPATLLQFPVECTDIQTHRTSHSALSPVVHTPVLQKLSHSRWGAYQQKLCHGPRKQPTNGCGCLSMAAAERVLGFHRHLRGIAAAAGAERRALLLFPASVCWPHSTFSHLLSPKWCLVFIPLQSCPETREDARTEGTTQGRGPLVRRLWAA